MAELCITTAAEACGRAVLDDAIDHAHDRAVALGVRQAVVIQPDRYHRTPYFRIVAAGRPS